MFFIAVQAVNTLSTGVFKGMLYLVFKNLVIDVRINSNCCI